MNEMWIKTKDRLPDVWKDAEGTLVNYLVFMPDSGVDIANYLQPADEWVCLGIPVKVTHWMEMPKPPTKKK
ncbi:MAG: DUF551 domain-containing protein [Clostridia bacterium]|nr:DUF551 domain-containing protein [Clostridia bacterium]